MTDTFKLLLDKYLDRTITQPEMKQLAQLLELPDHQVYLASVIDEDFRTKTITRLAPEPDTDGIYHKILLATNQSAAGKVVPIRRETSRLKWIAAAVLIAVILTSVWLMVGRDANKGRKEVATTNQHTGNDALPGSQGAVLTLADGTVITLDSTINGVITKQGATNIVKQNGTISYSDVPSPAGNEVVYNTLTTPKGRTYNLQLNDGTTVWLDAGSSIRYPVKFTGTERKVEITGQAWFDVVHNAKMPFKVIARGVEINDLGTQFNVNAYEDEDAIKTTLIEGSVRVVGGDANGRRAGVDLKPGQQAELTRNAQLITHNNIELDEVLAWKNGKFSFNGADLQTVMKQISRWYDMEIVYQGTIPTDKFEGMISRYSKLSDVLKILNLSGVKYSIEGSKLVIRNE